MSTHKNSAEFRFCYSTPRYTETVSFYKDTLELEEFRSWDRGDCQKGTIFKSTGGTGLIEIEEGPEAPIIQGELYIEVEDVDVWYEGWLIKRSRLSCPSLTLLMDIVLSNLKILTS